MNADFKIFNASRYNEPKELLKFIVEENGDPSKYCNGMGSTALMAACEWGNIKCVKILLQHKADIHAVSATFRNALMTCCFYGKYKCAKALIKYGAKLDEVNKRGWTALMFACARGHSKLVRLLLDSGANFEKKDRLGNRAIMIASVNSNWNIVHMLLDRGAVGIPTNNLDDTPWLAAVSQGNIGTMSELIFKDAACTNYDLSSKKGIDFALKLYATQHVSQINCYVKPPAPTVHPAIARAKRKKKKKAALAAGPKQ